MTIDQINSAYGLDIVAAPIEKIKPRAIELCDEYAAKHDGYRAGDDIARATFDALRRMWELVG